MNYKIESQKTKKEILGIIQANTSDRRRPLVAGYGKFFYGKVLDDSFQIQRRVDFRNEFLAVIIGKISESENGSTIDIMLRLGSLLKGFLIFWFAVVSSMCVVFPVIMIGYGFTPFFLIPYGMLIFGILLVSISWKKEIKIVIKKLDELLKDK